MKLSKLRVLMVSNCYSLKSTRVLLKILSSALSGKLLKMDVLILVFMKHLIVLILKENHLVRITHFRSISL